jgi:hypothetical protein
MEILWICWFGSVVVFGGLLVWLRSAMFSNEYKINTTRRDTDLLLSHFKLKVKYIPPEPIPCPFGKHIIEKDKEE